MSSFASLQVLYTCAPCFVSGVLQGALQQLMLFNNLDKATQRKIVGEMYERPVAAGEILISEGDVGIAASQLYVVKSGKFEVRGACFYTVRASSCSTSTSL